METDQPSLGEGQPREVWLYRHPMVIEAARSDEQLASRLDAVAQLEEYLAENPDDKDKQLMYDSIRGVVELDCRTRFPYLLESLTQES